MKTLSRHRLVVALCALCAALVAAPTAGAIGPGKVKPRQAKPRILSPSANRTYAAPTLVVRVKVPRSAKRFRARLNGEPVGRYFSPPTARGVRTLEVSVTFGLRYGENRLRVRAGSRSDHVRFRVARGRPLVGAGFDQVIAAGDTVYLDGETPSGSSIDWTEVSGPGSEGGLVETRADDAKFTPTRPGTYVLALRAEAPDGRSGVDLVAVRVDPVPAAEINTNAPCPPSHRVDPDCTGIKVGDAFYEADEPVRAWVQLVVLDRDTLEPVGGNLKDLANKTYKAFPKEDGPVPCWYAYCTDELRKDIQRIPRSALVIVSNPEGAFSPRGVAQVLGAIGVPPNIDFPRGKRGGTFSAVGQIGARVGTGDWHAVPGGSGGSGRMLGYLIRSNDGDFVYQPRDRVPFNTQAPGSDAPTWCRSTKPSSSSSCAGPAVTRWSYSTARPWPASHAGSTPPAATAPCRNG